MMQEHKLGLYDAVYQALSQVTGAYAIGVIERNNPNVLITARILIVGVGEGEFLLGSDASPIIEYTKNVIYPEDRQVIKIERGKEIEMIRSSGGLDIISDMTVNCSNFYEERNDKIYLTKNIGKEVRTNTEKKQTLTLIPTLTQKFNDELEPTVDIVLNNNVKVASTASWNQLYGLIYILRNVDIYTYAATMMNFIPRPDVGTNIYNMVPTYEEANKYGYKRPVKTFNPDSSYNGDYFAREQAKKEARKKSKKAKKEKEKEENKK